MWNLPCLLLRLSPLLTPTTYTFNFLLLSPLYFTGPYTTNALFSSHSFSKDFSHSYHLGHEGLAFPNWNNQPRHKAKQWKLPVKEILWSALKARYGFFFLYTCDPGNTIFSNDRRISITFLSTYFLPSSIAHSGLSDSSLSPSIASNANWCCHFTNCGIYI